MEFSVILRKRTVAERSGAAMTDRACIDAHPSGAMWFDRQIACHRFDELMAKVAHHIARSFKAWPALLPFFPDWCRCKAFPKHLQSPGTLCMLEQLIKNYLITNAKVDPTKFDQPELMVADLGIDSLTMVEMLFEIEDRFGFQLADPMRYQAMRLSDMVSAIETEVRAHHNGELPHIGAQDSTVSPQ